MERLHGIQQALDFEIVVDKHAHETRVRPDVVQDSALLNYEHHQRMAAAQKLPVYFRCCRGQGGLRRTLTQLLFRGFTNRVLGDIGRFSHLRPLRVIFLCLGRLFGELL